MLTLVYKKRQNGGNHKLKQRNFILLANQLEIKESLLFKEGLAVIELVSKQIDSLVAEFEISFKTLKTARLVRDVFYKRKNHLQKNVAGLR